MENPEETLQILEDWTARRARSCGSGSIGTLPRRLDEYLAHVARTGDPVFQWSSVKPLIKEKLLSAVNEFHETAPGLDVPLAPNVDPFNYEAMRSLLLERLDTFNAAPFTIQRLCELLTAPWKQYNRIDKFMRAVEKNVLVVSTREPGPVRREENEHIERTLNGSEENSDCGVDVDMEESTWRDMRQPSADPLAVTHHENERNDTSSLSIESRPCPDLASNAEEDKMDETPSVTIEAVKPKVIEEIEETHAESKQESSDKMEVNKEPEQMQIKEQPSESINMESEQTHKELENVTPITSSSEDDSNSNPEPSALTERETRCEMETEQKAEATSGEDSSSSNSSENTDGETEKGHGEPASQSPERSATNVEDRLNGVPEKDAPAEVISETKETAVPHIQTENYTIADIPTQAVSDETKKEDKIEENLEAKEETNSEIQIESNCQAETETKSETKVDAVMEEVKEQSEVTAELQSKTEDSVETPQAVATEQ